LLDIDFNGRHTLQPKGSLYANAGVSFMLNVRGIRFLVGCCSLVALLLVAQSFIKSHAAPTSCPFILGVKNDDASPCVVAADKLIKETSKRILEKIDDASAPTPEEIDALKTLVIYAQRWLLRDPSGDFPKNRLLAQMDALNEAIAIYPRDRLKPQGLNDVDGKIREVVPKLWGWTAGSPSGALTEQAKGLEAQLKDQAASEAVKLTFRSGLPKEFNSLVATTLDQGSLNATSTLIAASDTLSAFIDKNKGTVDMKSDVLVKSLFGEGLIGRLHALEAESGRPARTVLRRSLALKSELDKASTIQQALGHADVMNELIAIRKQTEALTASSEPKIHIIAAWYGHIGGTWSEGSQCSATAAMRTYCERKGSCSANGPGNANGAPLNPIQLCGLDPAPNARGLARGLTVDYACETGNDEFWAGLTKDPLTRPGGEAYSRSNSLRTVLRSPAMTLNCVFPAR
jgi:hypothetical protein